MLNIYSKQIKLLLRMLVHTRILYQLIVITFYENVPENKIEELNLNPAEGFLQELESCAAQIQDILEVADEFFDGNFIAIISADALKKVGFGE